MKQTNFTDDDLNKIFKIKVYLNDRDQIEYGTGESAQWLFDHRGQKVTCVEIGELEWCAKIQAQDGTSGWSFLNDITRVKERTYQPQLL